MNTIWLHYHCFMYYKHYYNNHFGGMLLPPCGGLRFRSVMPSSMAPMALPPDRLAAIEATGRELVALAMRTHGALSQDKQRVRRLLRALWAVGLVLGLGFLHRRRRQIAASIRGGPRPRGDAPLLGVPASAALLGV
jgi:hypothetical protein